MRNRSGWLTADRLRMGEREQYAITRLSGQHEVILLARPGRTFPFVVTHVVRDIKTNAVIESHEWCSESVDDMRRLFQARVRKHTSG